MEEEIKERQLDSPLVVHKKDDASFQETASEVAMSSTHTDEETGDAPTLERHRFKKKKKKKKAPYILLLLIAIVVAVVCALAYNGVIPFSSEETTTVPTSKSYVTQAENDFEGIITVKGTYIFFEGKEVDGIQGLEKEVKYLDKGTKFTIQDENADSDFLNFDVLSILSKYGIDYDITHIVSSGLISQYETTATTTASTTASTTKAESTTENSQQNN
jgi:uncharacterized protein (UPF0333 family)